MADDITVGGTVSRSFSIWKAEFVTLTLLSGLLYTPQILIVLLEPVGARGWRWESLSTLVGAFSGSVLTGATVFNVFQHVRGRKASFRECLDIGVSRFLPIIGVSILVGLGVMAGLFALVIPGIILGCMWSVSIPVTVVERANPIRSLKRSGALTADKGWTLFLTWFVLLIIAYGFVFIGAAIGGAVMVGNPTAGRLIIPILMIPVAPMLSVPQSVLYYQLKMLKEGVGIEELAAVFD